MAGECLKVSLALSGAVVLMQIHPWKTGTDHSPPHTPILVPVIWSLPQPSCMCLCLGTLNKPGQKAHYLSLIPHFFPVHSLFGKESCCPFPCVLISIKRQLFPAELETRFWFRACKVGLGNISRGKRKDVNLRVMKTLLQHPWSSLMDPVGSVLFLWKAVHGRLFCIISKPRC